MCFKSEKGDLSSCLSVIHNAFSNQNFIVGLAFFFPSYQTRPLLLECTNKGRLWCYQKRKYTHPHPHTHTYIYTHIYIYIYIHTHIRHDLPYLSMDSSGYTAVLWKWKYVILTEDKWYTFMQNYLYEKISILLKVDMTDWHKTFTEIRSRFDGSHTMKSCWKHRFPLDCNNWPTLMGNPLQSPGTNSSSSIGTASLQTPTKRKWLIMSPLSKCYIIFFLRATFFY